MPVAEFDRLGRFELRRAASRSNSMLMLVRCLGMPVRVMPVMLVVVVQMVRLRGADVRIVDVERVTAAVRMKEEPCSRDR